MRSARLIGLCIAAGTLLLFASGATFAAEQAVTMAGMKVTVWSPPAEASGRQPVIIFSHGFHGCATQSRFLTEGLAAAGYFVFAPNHRDAACGGGAARWLAPPQQPFLRPQQWSDATYRDRADDVGRLIDAIRTDSRFAARIDLSQLGLVGHSLGGYTVLGLAGAWPAWRLPGIKAVLALSPYSQPFIEHKTLAGLSAPVMYQGGTRDVGETPAIAKPDGAYDESPPPKYFVDFGKAGHFAWTNLGKTDRNKIDEYSVAFLNRYVRGESADAVLSQTLPGVVVFRFELGTKK
jgi:dienelactone hydrolase